MSGCCLLKPVLQVLKSFSTQKNKNKTHTHTRAQDIIIVIIIYIICIINQPVKSMKSGWSPLTRGIA